MGRALAPPERTQSWELRSAREGASNSDMSYEHAPEVEIPTDGETRGLTERPSNDVDARDPEGCPAERCGAPGPDPRRGVALSVLWWDET